MKKLFKYLLIIMAIGFVANFFVKEPDSNNTTAPLLSYEIIGSNQDISKRHYNCDILIDKTTADKFSKEELLKQLKRIDKKEACGVSSFFYSKEGQKAQYSASFAKQNPKALKDFLGKYIRKDNSFQYNK